LREMSSSSALAEPVAVMAGETSLAPVSGAVTPGLWARAKKWSTTGRAVVAIRGGAWSIVGYAATQLFRVVSTLVLARHFLGPEPFGIVGLVGVFLAGLSMFSEMGLVANVVQHPRGDEPRFLRTAFSIQAGRGFIIWTLAALASYPVAVFYKQPQLFPLLVVAGFSEMVRGFTSTAVWTCTRHVKLRNITLLAIAGEVIAFGVCIVWAVISPSAWALVARTVASAVVYAAGSYFIAKPLSFGWDRSSAKDILHFGGWVSVATATYFLGCQSERLVLGKFVTAAELGCFSLALMISSVPAGGISQLVNQIFLPILSKSVRTGEGDAVRDYQRSRSLFFAVALVAGLGFLLCGKPMVTLLLTSKYRMTGWILQALGLRLALDIFAGPPTTLLLAYGKTKYSAAANTARLVLMISGIWIAFAFFGLREAVIALIVAQALSYFPLIWGLKKLLPEVVAVELRSYGLFLMLLTLAVAIVWRGAY
jgi:O-antigen/teichoic acid export membrane protein